MDKYLRAAKIFAKLLDNQFSVFGIRFGLDPILDLIPGLGDIAGLILSLYLVWIGLQLELPRNQLWMMLKNIVIDFIVGFFPIVGPVADLFYKSNLMNLEILETFAKNIVEGEIVNK